MIAFELPALLLLLALTYFINERLKKLENKKYLCFFKKEIISYENDNSLASLTLRYSLTIEPQVGIGIDGKKYDKVYSKGNTTYFSDLRDFYTGNILHIHWSEENDSYSCETESYKMKQDEALGEVIARYCNHAWDIGFLQHKAEAALEKYIQEMEREMDPESWRFSEEEDRLRRLKNKLKLKDEEKLKEDLPI